MKDSKNLRDRLQDWHDFDSAQYELGVVLGIFEEGEDKDKSFRQYKSVFWSNNPLGNSLFKTLERLVQCGVLLGRHSHEDDDPTVSYDQFKWNPDYDF